MDPQHSGEVFKHLAKQNEMLMNAYNSMSYELQKLQVEEEMLMRKFYELMQAQGLTKKNEGNSIQMGAEKAEPSSALVAHNTDDSAGGKSSDSADGASTTSDEQR